jgi:general secretion pathway protein G
MRHSPSPSPRFPRAIGRAPSRALQRGMSLLEIIIVIVLIGSVLTFVGSRVLGGADRAKANLAKSQVSTLAGKIEQFEMDTGGLPNSLDDLVTQPGDASGWLGPYAKAAELKDPWGHPIEYRVPGESGPFDLVILGKDGQVGGDSYNADIRYE